MSVQYSPWADVALEYRANFTQWLLDNSEGRPADPCFIDGLWFHTSPPSPLKVVLTTLQCCVWGGACRRDLHLWRCGEPHLSHHLHAAPLPKAG